MSASFKNTVIMFSTIIIILIGATIAGHSIEADIESDWEHTSIGAKRKLGVDNENNLLLFSAGANYNYSQSSFFRYSPTGEIELNKTLDMNYLFPSMAYKKIDTEGYMYLYLNGPESLNVWKYTNDINLVEDYIIDVSDDKENLHPPYHHARITEVGTIYLIDDYSYTILNLTHAKNIDHLFKIKESGKLLWSLSFEQVIRRESLNILHISENQEGVLYFSYYNQLYRINSNNGEIEWKREFPYYITGLTSVKDDVCIAYTGLSEYSPMLLTYITKDNTTKWSMNISTQIGCQTVVELESKANQVGLHTYDAGYQGISGEATDNWLVVNSEGHILVNESWFYYVYFLHRKYFSLTTENSYYYLYHSIISGTSISTTIVASFNYIDPLNTPSPSPGFNVSIPTALGIITILIIQKKRYKKKNLHNSTGN